MSATTDLVGKRFGRLTVIERGKNKGRSAVLCLCDCGTKVTPLLANVKRGKTTSCGCYRQENTAQMKATHGLSKTPEHRSWMHMRERCCNVTSKDYKNYGGRGIKVCARWINSFSDFLADMGPRPSSRHTIERLDNDGPYEPQNCVWATRLEQNNNKRNTHLFEYSGKALTLTQWGKELDINHKTLATRVYSYKWSIERALSEGVHSR